MIKNSSAGEKRLLLRRLIVFGAVGFILAIAQCSFFSRLKPFGASPDLILGSLCAIILLDGKKCGAVYAVAVGYFIDAIGSVPPSFSPVFYLLCTVILGMIAEKMMPRFVSFAVLMLPAIMLRAVFTYFNLWLSSAVRPTLGTFAHVALPEMLSTAVFCLPVYFIIRLCMYPIRQESFRR